MRETSLLPGILSQLLPQLLSFLVYLAGIVLALVYWKRYPRPSLLTLIAMALMMLNGLVGTILTVVILRTHGPENVAWIFSIVGIGRSVVGAGALGLLLAAVYSRRQPNTAMPGVATGPTAFGR